MTLISMTGFADLAGASAGSSWNWEARSVNGRGLDLRLRLPEGLEALEAPLRAALGQTFHRGSVSVGLRMARGGTAGMPRLNPEALEAAIVAAEAAGVAASAAGLHLAPMTAADLLAVRGVLESDTAGPAQNPEVIAALTADIAVLVARLGAARAAEGEALGRLVAGQIDRIAALTEAARATAEVRAARSGALLRARVEALLAATAALDESRLAQELALIAVKADVTEELDRLEAHIAAARKLLTAEGPVGRKLDFLTQEFNREANTLCSKASASDLTAVGLELKVVIDQMREQVQNVE
ncbi:MAG: YicC/YloC family endoribonuclease [Amaricoccus sp.]